MVDSEPMPDHTREPLRHDWTIDEIEAIYTQPLSDLIFNAQRAHRAWHASDEVQGCVLLSIKTGGCPEDCAYCPQSSHYDTGSDRAEHVSLKKMTKTTERARDQGETRFCMN